jgi:polysaccharide export outer membrane protein
MLIGPGDQLNIQVFDTPELSQIVRVTDQGNLPLLFGGSVHVSSLTPAEAATAIERALVQGKIMNNPHVAVTIMKFATQNVTVFGQVMRPGEYAIDTPRTVLDVLTLAGGLSDLADRHVVVEHSGQRSSYFVSNTPDKALTDDPMVYPGDLLVVPKAGIVYVLGDVGRPGGFPMTNNDSGLTALQAVALAGTTAPSAVPSHARLIRRMKNGGFQEIPLPLGAMQKGKRPDVALQDSDIIYIPFSYLRNAALGLTSLAAAAESATIYAH